MNKKIIAIHFNDLHIKQGNEEDIINAVKHMISVANEHNVKQLICNGDVFDSRSFQRLSFLKTWEKCLDLFHSNGMICHTNVGNHDKSRYDSEDSFLDSFRYHPAMRLYSKVTDVEINGYKFTFSPFFTDQLLVPMLQDHPGGDFLIGHWEMEGSTHLGKTSKKQNINRTLLKKWKKTYLGHFHNAHDINKNISHLPSMIQDSFGEDDNKGFTFIFDDLSYEIVNGVFKRFNKLSLDIDSIDISDIKKLISVHSGSPDTVRFEFTGTDSKLKAIDKSMFKGTGIDIKIKYQVKYDAEDDNVTAPKVTEVYGEDEIKKIFEEFCCEKGYDYDEGCELLEEFLNKNNGKE